MVLSDYWLGGLGEGESGGNIGIFINYNKHACGGDLVPPPARPLKIVQSKRFRGFCLHSGNVSLQITSLLNSSRQPSKLNFGTQPYFDIPRRNMNKEK
jgi:hypothetical protein